VPNISIHFAFALVVVAASLAASIARQATSAATKNAPVPAIESRKCLRGSLATADQRNRAEFVHTDGVCWAPNSSTGGPESKRLLSGTAA
jgi:hypothetical protein